jgi:hypothetical protein
VSVFAIDGPDESKVRLQPNSRVNGSKNSPVAAIMTEKNENPTDAASTSGQFAFHSIRAECFPARAIALAVSSPTVLFTQDPRWREQVCDGSR